MPEDPENDAFMRRWNEAMNRVLEADRRRHPNETPAQRKYRRSQAVEREKQVSKARRQKYERELYAQEVESWRPYIKKLRANIQKLERMKDLAARRDEAWIDKERIVAELNKRFAFWPPGVRAAWEQRHGVDAVADFGWGRPKGFTEWQQSQLDKLKGELFKYSSKVQEYDRNTPEIDRPGSMWK